MSIQRIVNVTCDQCHDSTDNVYLDAREARADARMDGWRVCLPGGRDLCPACRNLASD